MEVLFVNGSIRKKEDSRTYALAQAFLQAYVSKESNVKITTLDLTKAAPKYYDLKMLDARNQAVKERDFSSPLFDFARQFAAADRVVLAAPFWDLSFPAVVKAYIENLCITNLTFRYSEQGEPIGLCRADKMMFVGTSGGYVDENNALPDGFGAAYLRSIARMLGIDDFKAYYAQGLDIIGNDAEAIMESAKAEIREIAVNW